MKAISVCARIPTTDEKKYILPSQKKKKKRNKSVIFPSSYIRSGSINSQPDRILFEIFPE